MVHRKWNALIWFLLVLVGCAQPTPTPRIVILYPEGGTVGRLVYQDGCWRLVRGESSVQLIWPPDFRVRVQGTVVYIDEGEMQVTLPLGGEVWLQGEALTTYRNKRNRERIEAFRRQGSLPAHCSGPYELVKALAPWMHITGTLQKGDGCWYIRGDGGRKYALVLQRPLRPYKDKLYYVDWKERRGHFLSSGAKLTIEGRVYPRVRGKERVCTPPHLFTDFVSLPPEGNTETP